MNLSNYIQSLFVPEDKDLKKIEKNMTKLGMPSISVAAETGKLLSLLVKISGAENMLEIGALGGYSGICLLRGSNNGKLTSLELEESYAEVANHHVKEAGFEGQVKYKIGPALDTLERLLNNDVQYDFFFIDADKENYLKYLNYCIQLAKPRAIIAADNTLWGGTVLYDFIEDKDTQALDHFNKHVSKHPKLESILIPIGDGLTIARVK